MKVIQQYLAVQGRKETIYLIEGIDCVNISIGDNIIDNVKSVKYLGFIIGCEELHFLQHTH